MFANPSHWKGTPLRELSSSGQPERLPRRKPQAAPPNPLRRCAMCSSSRCDVVSRRAWAWPKSAPTLRRASPRPHHICAARGDVGGNRASGSDNTSFPLMPRGAGPATAAERHRSEGRSVRPGASGPRMDQPLSRFGASQTRSTRTRSGVRRRGDRRAGPRGRWLFRSEAHGRVL